MFDVEKAIHGCSISDVPRPASCFGARHFQMLMLFLWFAIGYGMRVILSVGIVAMTDPTLNPGHNIPTYNWDNKNIILSSFFWGYVIPQIGAGQLAKLYGPKWFLAGALFVSSIFSVLIPFTAPLGSWYVIACRIIQGFSQGFIAPCAHNMLAKWIPLNERARMGTFVYAGGTFGTIISMPVTGWISNSTLGWPFAFYLYGGIGMVWILVWSFVGKNSPADHKTMEPDERKYLEMSLGLKENTVDPPTPWKDILTSLPVWAIFIATSGETWGFSTLLTNIPTYMGSILKFDIASNGLLSAGPYLVFWLSSFVFSGVTDYVIANKLLTIGTTRKIANTIGLWIPAVALISLAAISGSESDITTITLVIFFIAVGVNSCCFSGFNVNIIDLSPNHAGIVMGCTNGVSVIFAILAPIAVEYIVIDEEDPEQWAIIFYIASGFYLVSNLFFLFFASGEIQPWNSKVYDRKIETDSKNRIE